MKLRTFVLTLVAMISVGTLSSAQSAGKKIENRAKRRAEYKVNREVDKSVDKAIDNVFDGLFGKKKKKPKKEDQTTVPGGAAGQEDSEVYDEAEKQRKSQEAVAGMMGGAKRGNWVPVRNDYPISFNMLITSEQKGKEEVTNVRYTLDTWVLGMAMQPESEGEEMLLLMDNENGTMTTVMEKDGKRQGYRMNRSAIDYDAYSQDQEETKITATGNTKMIDGYFCREYLIEHREGTTNAWMTKEIQADFGKLYLGFSGSPAGKGQQKNDQLFKYKDYGMMLEGTTVSKNGKETTRILISNLKTGDQIDRSILDLSNVEIMGIGN